MFRGVLLHGLLTSVTAFEDWFAVLNRLLAIGVLFVSVDASVFFFEDRCVAVLHGLLTSVTAFEDSFAVLNRLVAIGVLLYGMKSLFIHAALTELTYWDPCDRFLRMLDLLGPFEKIRSGCWSWRR